MKELSKYEYARIIGARALQLSLGAPPLFKLKKEHTDSISVAQIEYDKKILPLSIA